MHLVLVLVVPLLLGLRLSLLLLRPLTWRLMRQQQQKWQMLMPQSSHRRRVRRLSQGRECQQELMLPPRQVWVLMLTVLLQMPWTLMVLQASTLLRLLQQLKLKLWLRPLLKPQQCWLLGRPVRGLSSNSSSLRSSQQQNSAAQSAGSK